MNVPASAIVDVIAKKQTEPEGYMGEDGNIYCLKCGKPKTMLLNKPELGLFKRVGILCDCGKKEDAERTRREFEQMVEDNRKRCFQESRSAEKDRLISATFERDDNPDCDASRIARGYSKLFQEAICGGDSLKKGTGLLLYGPPGTGKSFYAACIANDIISRGHTAMYTTFGMIAARMQESYEARPEIMQELEKPSLLILDDLGAERDTEYMNEIVFEVINLRYRRSKPMIVTTNLTATELMNTEAVGKNRVYDRLIECCEPVAVTGGSMRKKMFTDRHKKAIDAMKGAK
jgi:DNA replication protein DnaC